MAGLATYPMSSTPSITPSTGVNASTAGKHTWQPHSQYSLHTVLPAHSDVSGSGEDELEWESDEEDPISHLTRCIESLGGIPEHQEWDARA